MWSKYQQTGGGRCSLCGSEGTNMTSCPKNPKATKPNYIKHPKATKPTATMVESTSVQKAQMAETHKVNKKERVKANKIECSTLIPDEILNEERINVYETKDYYYKVPNSPVEQELLIRLADSGLTPEVSEISECTHRGIEGKVMLKIERYDGTLFDFADKYGDDPESIKAAIQEIIRKSNILNKQYGIRHGDFHSGNILYKIDKITDNFLSGSDKNIKPKFAFIDFELSTLYDKNGRVIMSGLNDTTANVDESYFAYDPFYDLAALEINGLPRFEKYFLEFKEVPDESRRHFLSTLGEADMEMIEEGRADNVNKTLLSIPF